MPEASIFFALCGGDFRSDTRICYFYLNLGYTYSLRGVQRAYYFHAKAEGVSNVTFCRGDATGLDFPDGSFDAVMSNYVYHNIPGDRKSVLMETLRVLKKGGTFALHDIFSKAKYGDMQAFVQKLRDLGYESVELIDTTDGRFMTRQESAWMALSGSALLIGRKKQSDVAVLLKYAGSYKRLTFLGLGLSAAAMILGMAPYICIWLAARDLIAAAPDWTEASGIARFGWMAFGFAVAGIAVYFAALMCTHLAAFRTASNIRKQGMAHLMKAPLGFFDSNASGLIRNRLDWVKLFMDGTVESGSGFVDPLYPDGHQGLVNWTEEEATDITRKANGCGMSMHVHTMGNKAVNRAVNAFVSGGKDEMRNTLVHVRNVNPEDWKRMADHNIYATAGMHWHHFPNGVIEILKGVVPAGMEDKFYPMKSYFDNGLNVSSHSDYPALGGSPDDPFGIMEIAVTGVLSGENGAPLWPEELLTREQALTALTINCAKQMFLEDERGSISEGKCADFLLVDKDVLSCPVNEIHTARTIATYFEGKKVFSQN